MQELPRTTSHEVAHDRDHVHRTSIVKRPQGREKRRKPTEAFRTEKQLKEEKKGKRNKKEAGRQSETEREQAIVKERPT